MVRHKSQNGCGRARTLSPHSGRRPAQGIQVARWPSLIGIAQRQHGRATAAAACCLLPSLRAAYCVQLPCHRSTASFSCPGRVDRPSVSSCRFWGVTAACLARLGGIRRCQLCGLRRHQLGRADSDREPRHVVDRPLMAGNGELRLKPRLTKRSVSQSPTRQAFKVLLMGETKPNETCYQGAAVHTSDLR